MFKEIINLIKEADCISLFRHINPDGDCAYAQYAFRDFIKLNFKDKKVKCVANQTFKSSEKLIKVSDNYIKNSLAIILDCSTENRVDDNRYKLAKNRISIDHHPQDYVDLCEHVYADQKKSATCELLAEIFFSDDFKDFQINKKICEYLYCGILYDANRFTTSNTTADTFYYASLLVKKGELNVSELNATVFAKDFDIFNKISKFRTFAQIKNGVLYCIVDEKVYNETGLTIRQAKEAVVEFQAVQEAKIWAVFAYDKDSNSYDGSIRSRDKYAINKLCKKYNGGGHKNACGVKKMTLASIDTFVDECIKIINR